MREIAPLMPDASPRSLPFFLVYHPLLLFQDTHSQNTVNHDPVHSN